MKFDNILSKAKDVFEVAYRKADDAISVKKQKFDIASLENKMSKDFEALGRICFEEMKNGVLSENEEAKKLLESINEKQAQIEEIKKEIAKAKSK